MGVLLMSNDSLNKLFSIITKLRDKETGCTWYKKQTPQSLAKYAIEEAYELSNAISNEGIEEYKKELGDLLYQVAFHAQFAKENNWFDFDDIVKSISNKLISRNTHIFGSDKAETIEEVDALWQKRKQEEKSENAEKSIFDNVSSNLPSLLECQKISQKAVDTGFEWDKTEDVIEVIRNELTEVEEEVIKDRIIQERVLDEVGDVFFAAVNLARKAGVDPELALKHTNQKFRNRFKFIEKKHNENSLDINITSLETKQKYWDEAKKEGL
jgi:ATP diphosphatase